MQLEAGQVVRVMAGHDKDSYMLVVGFESDRVLLCDGRQRPLERPKRKNPLHVAATNHRLDDETARTNRSLRKALNALKAENAEGR